MRRASRSLVTILIFRIVTPSRPPRGPLGGLYKHLRGSSYRAGTSRAQSQRRDGTRRQPERRAWSFVQGCCSWKEEANAGQTMRFSAFRYGTYFTGTVRIDPLFDTRDPQRVSGASVTF